MAVQIALTGAARAVAQITAPVPVSVAAIHVVGIDPTQNGAESADATDLLFGDLTSDPPDPRSTPSFDVRSARQIRFFADTAGTRFGDIPIVLESLAPGRIGVLNGFPFTCGTDATRTYEIPRLSMHITVSDATDSNVIRLHMLRRSNWPRPKAQGHRSESESTFICVHWDRSLSGVRSGLSSESDMWCGQPK